MYIHRVQSGKTGRGYHNTPTMLTFSQHALDGPTQVLLDPDPPGEA